MASKEEALLLDIQKRLDSLWPVIDFYNSQTGLSDYSAPVGEASRTVEIMCALLVYEHGYDWELGHGPIKVGSTNNTSRIKFGSALTFICHGELEDVPKEIKDYLNLIRKSRNKAVHSLTVSYGEAVIFAEAFDCFTAWFVVNSVTLKKASVSLKNDFCSHVNCLSKRMTFQIKIGDAEAKDYISASVIPRAIQAIQTGNHTNNMTIEILSKLAEMLGLLKKIDSGVIKIDKKVDEIADKLDEITKIIGDYQSLVSRQIEMANNKEEIDRIISAYTDECVSRIVNGVNGRYAEKAYSAEKAKLMLSLGESIWNKLDPVSQNFLITAKVTYNNLVTMSDIIDYSGVCLLVTKAVEVEMSNRFYKKYREFLRGKYPGKSGYTQYPTPLIDKYGKPISAKHFTLGTVAYILCYSLDDSLTPEQINNNHAKLMEFMSSCLMKGKNEQVIDSHVQFIAEGVEDIRTDYRNPSAHTNQLKSTNAQQCFDLVLDVEKLLKTMLDSLDY